jgi:hypothetical protein
MNIPIKLTLEGKEHDLYEDMDNKMLVEECKRLTKVNEMLKEELENERRRNDQSET